MPVRFTRRRIPQSTEKRLTSPRGAGTSFAAPAASPCKGCFRPPKLGPLHNRGGLFHSSGSAMASPELTAAIAKLLRAMPHNPIAIAIGEALKAEQAAPRVTTPMVTAELQGAPASPEVVTRAVTPKRDRAKYMRDYRAKKTA